jgi:hypothetical protein
MPTALPVRRECYPREIPQPGGPKSGPTSINPGSLRKTGGDLGSDHPPKRAQPGQMLKIRPEGNSLHLFDAESGRRIAA